ncbi:transmembrane protein 70 homolog, mitochondrial [Lingula anatina]|nr:transmembrane protein 70 homolog, mitochondrial [Lingula anatina]|eukprot:XP_013383225.1 transmembrane protein 70 homolog, mitochondrial [Lingula anatina]
MLKTFTSKVGYFSSVALQCRFVNTPTRYGRLLERHSTNFGIDFQSRALLCPNRKLFSRTLTTAPKDRTNAQQCNHFCSSQPANKDLLQGPVVYEGNLNAFVRGVKVFSLSTSCITLSLQPFILMRASELPVSLLVGGEVFAALFFLTPVLIHWATKGYIFKLHFNEDKKLFTAVHKSFFMREKKTQFKAEEMAIPDVPGPFSTVKIKDKNYFIILENDAFDDQKAFMHLMQYDKPFKMPSEQESGKN